MKKILAALFLATGVAAYAAGQWTQFEQRGVQRIYSERTSSVSTHTVSGIGVGWSVKAVGGAADFEVKYASVTHAGADPSVNVSSTIYVLQGETVRSGFLAVARNPIIYIKRIDQPGTTVYVDIGYLQPRQPGDF